MKRIFYLKNTFDWTQDSLQFLKRNFLIILVLGLIAGIGRAAQLRAFGEISAWLNVTLEVLIESARILTFIFALGLTNCRNGVNRIRAMFSRKADAREKRQLALFKLKTQWRRLFWNMAAFLLISLLINLFIDHIAYETCMLVSLQDRGIIDAAASEWTIILFLKNISVIPLSLVFNAMCLLWLINKLPSHLNEGQELR